MRFKLRQMEIFQAVMATGSISNAAKMLFISQPAVSKILAHTESKLKVQLFIRHKGKLIPTDEAHRLYAEVKKVYAAALKVDDFVYNLAHHPEGFLNLCCSPSLGLNFLPNVIKSYSEKYPNIKIHLHTTLLQDIPLELLSKKSDAAICVLPLEHPNLLVEPLFTGRMVCIVPDSYQHLVNKEEISLHDLVNEKLILYSRDIPFGQLLLNALNHHDIDLHPIIDVPRAELACALVSKGVGVSIVDEFSVSHNLWSNLIVKPLKELIPIKVSLIESIFENEKKELNFFKDVLKRHLNNQFQP